MKNNRGVTLVEIIVVIAIAGILAGGSIFGARMLGIGSAKRAAGKINSMLDSVKLENMTKNKTHYLIIREDNGKYFMEVKAGTQILSTEELKLVRGEITYQKKGDTNTYLVSSTPVPGRDISLKLEITFKKDTGGIAANSNMEVINRIGITSAGSSYNIALVEATGKHYID